MYTKRSLNRWKLRLRKLVRSNRSPLSTAGVGLNYLLYRADLLRLPFAMHRPIFMQVEPTSRCNLRCPMCMRDKIDVPAGDMQFDQFKSLVDSLPGLVRIHLQGNGEPFLHPELTGFIRYAKSKGIQVSTISNGTLLSDELADEIVTSGLDEIQFSLDSLDEDEYARIRVGAKLPRVIENIRRMVRTRNQKQSDIAVSIAIVVQRSNMDSLDQFITFASETGLSKISVQYLEPKHEDRYNEGFLADNSPFADGEALLHKLIHAKSIAESENIEFDFVPQRTRVCRWPWEGLYITWDGKVTPCCLIFDHVIGDAFKEGPAHIWNNRKMRAFRRQLRSEQPPPQCKGCSHSRDWKLA